MNNPIVDRLQIIVLSKTLKGTSRTVNVRFSSINAIKADFSDIYTSDDPRDYFSVLGKLNYVIPQLAAPVLLQSERLIEIKGRPVTILDVGCSYGLLSATAQLGLSIRQLCARYEADTIQALDPGQLASFDAKYFASWPKRPDIRFIGLSMSLPKPSLMR